MKYKIGTKEKPLALKTPPLTSEYTMHTDEKEGKEILVCTVNTLLKIGQWEIAIRILTRRRQVTQSFAAKFKNLDDYYFLLKSKIVNQCS